jgi:hypothetical protein
MVVVAPEASGPTPASVDPPLELPELPEEPPDPPEPLELPEPPESAPESPWDDGGDDELLPQANRWEDAIDATPREVKARERDFMGAPT